jgi:hypothetical protein
MIWDVQFTYGSRVTHQRFDETFESFVPHALATHQRFDAILACFQTVASIFRLKGLTLPF